MTITRSLCSALLIAVGCATPVFAQAVDAAKPAPTAPPAAEPAAPPAAPKKAEPAAPVMNAEAKAVLDRALAAYKGFKSYADVMTLSQSFSGTDPEGGPIDQKHSDDFSFTQSSPGVFSMKNKVASMFGDGKTVTLDFHPFGQHMQGPADKLVELVEKAGPFKEMAVLHPIASFMTGLSKDSLPMIKTLDSATAETRAGVKGKLLKGIGRAPGPDNSAPLTLFFADDTGLLVEGTLDLTQAYKEMLGGEDGPKIDKFEMKMSFADVKSNTEIDAKTLAFVAPSGSKKVDKLDMGMGDEGGRPDPQQDLVGKAAPAWELKNFDGATVKLADFKGKVVVMDFWASWCGPCIKGLPYMQELWTKFEKKDVIFLGMNTDDNHKAITKAKQILESKKVTIPQVSDIAGSVGNAYKVNGIPCLVIVGKDGVVQTIHTGFSPGMEKMIEAEVEKVLKGENLFTAPAKAAEPTTDKPKADAAAPADEKKAPEKK